jgi:membrane protease YdiL (CAAX protease family)
MENKEADLVIVKPYLIGTFILILLTWGTIIIANKFGIMKFGTPLCMILYIIGGNSPPIIAIYLILSKKILSFKELLHEIFSFKQNILLYLLVFIFAVTIQIIPYCMGYLISSKPIYLVLVFIPVMIIGGGLEEIGWRFILQPSLEKKLPFVIASLVTAVIWSVWHLPLFFIEGTTQFSESFVSFSITVLGLSFSLATIFRLSQSVWLCILLHALYNSFSGVLIFTSDKTIMNIVNTGSLIIISTIINIIFKIHVKRPNCT